MTSQELPSLLKSQVTELIKQNRKVEAVKVVHESMKCGLLQAKKAVDKLAKEIGQ